MSFLSFVLIFVSLSMVQMLRSYDKGVTIKQVDQAGRVLTDDLSRLVRTASATTDVVSDNIDRGVICVGNVAYVWNPVFKANKTYQSTNRYTFNPSGPDPAEQISLARVLVPDPTLPGSVCRSTSPTTFFYTKDGDNYALLSQRSRVVWASAARSSDGKILKLTFYLGTYDDTETAALAAGTVSDIYNTPYFPNTAPATPPQCREGDDGGYCFVSSFETSIYLPNALN